MASTLVSDARERAFERLYRHHVREVYRFALALLRNPAEAEDVTQTTFLNAYRAIQAGEEPRRPQNWLLTIAHNTARSRVRLAMRRPKEVPLEDVVHQLAVPEHERTNVRELLRALGRLPFNQRAAITMRELEGRSYPEIAETLGVSVPAVEALLARARRTLRMQASAIRGLTVVGLPRPLRRLLEEYGEAGAGGALGAGAAAKAAAVLLAGVAAGGIGFASGHAGAPDALSPPGPALVRHVALASVAMRHVRAPATPRAASERPASGHAGAMAPAAPQRVRPLPDESSADTSADAAAPSGGAAAPAAAASTPASAEAASAPMQPVGQPVRSAVAQPVSSAVQPTEPAPSPTETLAAVVAAVAPPAPAAPVQAPAVPPLPQAPPAPSLPPVPTLP